MAWSCVSQAHVLLQALTLSNVCREAADAAALLLGHAALTALSRVAGADPKHGERLRYETLAGLQAALQLHGLSGVAAYRWAPQSLDRACLAADAESAGPHAGANNVSALPYLIGCAVSGHWGST